jgi:hypothetical protein
MSLRIRTVCEDDVDAVVRLSLLAWDPIFSSFERILGREIFPIIYPDWKTSQKEAVEGVCRDGEKRNVWVAELDGIVVGFVATELDMEAKTGEGGDPSHAPARRSYEKAGYTGLPLVRYYKAL